MKKWYRSKTLWVNILSLIGLILQDMYGKDVLTPETQIAILGILNILLRIAATEKISK